MRQCPSGAAACWPIAAAATSTAVRSGAHFHFNTTTAADHRTGPADVDTDHAATATAAYCDLPADQRSADSSAGC